MSQQGTVRKESRGGTLTQRGDHVVIPFKKLDSLPQVSGPGPHRKPRQARRHRPREMEAKKARFGHIDSKAKPSKQLKYLRKSLISREFAPLPPQTSKLLKATSTTRPNSVATCCHLAARRASADTTKTSRRVESANGSWLRATEGDLHFWHCRLTSGPSQTARGS